MSFKVKIIDTFVENFSGKSTKTGKDYSINNQVNCFIYINGEVRKYPLSLESGQKPYEPGDYEFNADLMLSINDRNNLVVTAYARPTLKKVG